MKINYTFIVLYILTLTSCASNNLKHSKIHENEDGTMYLSKYTTEERLEISKLTEAPLLPFTANKGGRNITKRNWKALFKNNRNIGKTGWSISLKLCVDRLGEVKYAEVLPEETTVTNKNLLKQSLRAAMGYKVEEAPKAAAIECGKFIINYNLD